MSEEYLYLIKVDQNDFVALFTNLDEAEEFMEGKHRYGYRIEVFKKIEVKE